MLRTVSVLLKLSAPELAVDPCRSAARSDLLVMLDGELMRLVTSCKKARKPYVPLVRWPQSAR